MTNDDLAVIKLRHNGVIILILLPRGFESKRLDLAAFAPGLYQLNHWSTTYRDPFDPNGSGYSEAQQEKSARLTFPLSCISHSTVNSTPLHSAPLDPGALVPGARSMEREREETKSS